MPAVRAAAVAASVVTVAPAVAPPLTRRPLLRPPQETTSQTRVTVVTAARLEAAAVLGAPAARAATRH
jgi:hypothetical protein